MQTLVTHVLGARPNFMKAAPVIGALGKADVEQMLIHTGQHYDARMSDVFFADLGLPEPDVNLHVGSGAHGEQTAAVIAGVERELMARRPTLLVVYGDVNSTLGAALAAAKLHVPIAHVEAGLRSFDNTMPEEINRRLTDQLCDLLFVTSAEAIGYLANEGIALGGVHFVGNTMIDTLVACLDRLDAQAARTAHSLPDRYMVATLHRPFNVDSPEAAALLVKAMHQIADMAPVIMPVHPRGRAMFEAAGLAEHPGIRMCEPLGYLEFMSLVRGAAAAITDSAGVQEETTFLRVQCLTLRPVTERPVTVTSGSNRLVRADELASAAMDALARGPYAGELPPLWDGASGPRIARIITSWLAARLPRGPVACCAPGDRKICARSLARGTATQARSWTPGSWFAGRQSSQQSVEEEVEPRGARAEIEGVLLEREPADYRGHEDVIALLGEVGADPGVEERRDDRAVKPAGGVGVVRVGPGQVRGVAGQGEVLVVHAPRDACQPRPPFRAVGLFGGQYPVDEDLAEEVEELVAVLDPPVERAVVDAEPCG
jgi:UDP-N-acetylglucosamine 2-epimerase